MEQEPQASPLRLIDVVKTKFPEASKVLVSFPDKWEFIDTVKQEQNSIYVAGFPVERAFHGREHFEGLPPEINVNLVFYRLYKFFQPCPTPQVGVDWDSSPHLGRIKDLSGWRLQMQPIGQAQAWFGVDYALLWECYLEKSPRSTNWQETLAELWQRVEQDVNAPTLFTAPHDPAFLEGYPEFLRRLGYAEDADYPFWWRKNRREEVSERGGERMSIT